MRAQHILFLVCGILMALYVIVQSLTGGFNSISTAYKYGLFASIIISFVNPRFGLILLILAAGYMDTFKRFLVIGGYVGYTDLIFIVGLPSLCSIALFAGCSAQFLFNPEKRKGDVQRFIFALIFTVVVIAGSFFAKKGGLGGLKESAVAAGFAPLVFVIPFLYRDMESASKMLRLVMWCFVPVALYTFWQAHFGLSDFEIAYLQTGLSQEDRILTQEQDFRFFSTLNSSQNLSKIMAMFGAYCLLMLFDTKDKAKLFPKVILNVVLGLIFFWAAYKSGARTGLLMGLFLIFAAYALRSRFLTISGYAISVVTLIVVIFTSDIIVKNKLHTKLQDTLYEITPLDRSTNRVFVFGTLTIRFHSLSGIASGEHLFPFGQVAAGQPDYSKNARLHEALSGFLVTFGYVPFLLVMAVVIPVLVKVHRALWKLDPFPLHQKLAIFGLANYFSVLFGALSASKNLATYPVTYFLYLYLGCTFAAFSIAASTRQKREAESKVEEGAEDGLPIPELTPQRLA